jgi:hypothetical protein
MRVYQSANLQWILWDGKTKTFFATQEEALSVANKIQFAKKVQAINTTIAQLFLDTKDLDGVYFSEGFDSAGSDPITDGDLTSLGITAAELAAGDTLFQQIQNLRNGDPVTAGDYQATVNALRSDLDLNE